MKKFAFILQLVIVISCDSSEEFTVAESFVNEVLDIMENNSIHRKSIDWVAFRKQVIGITGPAQTIEDTYIGLTEALKMLLGESPVKELIHVNVWKNDFKKIKVKENKNCKACQGEFEFLKPPKEDYKIEFCSSKAVMSAKPLRTMKLNMNSVKEKFKTIADASIVAVINVDGEEVIVHDYGELFFKKERNEDKLKEIAEKIYKVAK